MGKKKTTKQKDFVKKKFKVGKSKAPANNATNVSFKTQKIQVPNQKISSESETEELIQVLHSLQHHNDATKQTALLRLKAIFKASPKVLLLSTGLVCSTLAKSSLDLSDAFGRQILAFCELFFNLLNQSQIRPFFSTFVVYAGCAMTHINQSVRLRGLKHLSLMCEKYPELICKNASNLIEQYVQVLTFGNSNKGISTNNTTEKTSRFTSRIEMLKGFENYATLILGNSKKAGNSVSVSWCDQEALDLKFLSFPGECEDGIQINLNTKQGKKDFIPKKSGLESLVDIISVLVEFWIESAQEVFEGPEVVYSAHLIICNSVIRLLKLILPHIVSMCTIEQRLEWISLIRNHVQAQFPYGQSKSCKDMNTVGMLRYMNLSFVGIIIEMNSISRNETAISISKEFLVDIFEAKQISGLDDYMAIIQNLSSLLVSAHKNELMRSIVSCYIYSKTTSNSSRSLFFAIEKLMSYDNEFDSSVRQEWCQILPKVLWQLKSISLKYSASIIKFLKMQIISFPDQSDSLILSLVPMFGISAANGKFIFGPFLSYPAKLQELLLSSLFYIPDWPLNVISCVVRCLQELPSSLSLFFLDIVGARDMPIEMRANIEFSLILRESFDSILCNSLSHPETAVYEIEISSEAWTAREILLNRIVQSPSIIVDLVAKLKDLNVSWPVAIVILEIFRIHGDRNPYGDDLLSNLKMLSIQGSKSNKIVILERLLMLELE